MKSKRLVDMMADILAEEEVKRRIDEKASAEGVEDQYLFWGVECPDTPEGAERALYGRSDILREANELINGDRAKDYGDASVNFNRIASGWSVILGKEVSARQVALCMAWLKMARLVNSPRHRDSYVDGAAYMALAAELATP